MSLPPLGTVGVDGDALSRCAPVAVSCYNCTRFEPICSDADYGHCEVMGDRVITATTAEHCEYYEEKNDG